MPIGDPRNRFFNPTLTLVIDTYKTKWVPSLIRDYFICIWFFCLSTFNMVLVLRIKSWRLCKINTKVVCVGMVILKYNITVWDWRSQLRTMLNLFIWLPQSSIILPSCILWLWSQHNRKLLHSTYSKRPWIFLCFAFLQIRDFMC